MDWFNLHRSGSVRPVPATQSGEPEVPPVDPQQTPAIELTPEQQQQIAARNQFLFNQALDCMMRMRELKVRVAMATQNNELPLTVLSTLYEADEAQ